MGKGRVWKFRAWADNDGYSEGARGNMRLVRVPGAR